MKFKKDVDALIEKGEPKVSAILEIIRGYIKECKAIHFDGNGYSDEWKKEAARRGLDCETSVPVIFDNYLKPETIAMFEATGVMTKKELENKIATFTADVLQKKSCLARSPQALPTISSRQPRLPEL